MLPKHVQSSCHGAGLPGRLSAVVASSLQPECTEQSWVSHVNPQVWHNTGMKTLLPIEAWTSHANRQRRRNTGIKTLLLVCGLQGSLTPAAVVERLDKVIIGQEDAKKAVAIAFRNRYRLCLVNQDPCVWLSRAGPAVGGLQYSLMLWGPVQHTLVCPQQACRELAVLWYGFNLCTSGM
jgi:hypothetical protein